MAGRAAILALFPVIGVLGYTDTVPLVVWSSRGFVISQWSFGQRLTLAQFARVE